MDWWIIAIIVYCGLTYFLGICICLGYLISIELAKYTDKIQVKGDLNKAYWPAALFWTIISPIFVPWWILEFVKANLK